MTTALNLYGLTAGSTTLSSAGKLATGTGGTETNDNTSIGTATKYGEITSLVAPGGSWAASASIGSPTGNGWLWDVTTLEGQQIIAGTWSPFIRLSCTSGTITCTFYMRAYIYNNGTYTLIGTLSSNSGQTVNQTATTYTLTNAPLSAATFHTGDKLYIDLWPNVASNTGTSTNKFKLLLSSTSSGLANHLEMDTPGYIPAPTVTKSMGLRTPIRVQVTKSLGTRLLIRTQKAVSMALRTPIKTQITKSLIGPRTVIRNQVTKSLRLRANVTGGITKYLQVRVPLRVQRTLSAGLRTVIRNQVTLSLGLRAIIRGITRTAPIRVIIRPLKTASLVVRTRIATTRALYLTLRIIILNQFTRSLPIRTLLRGYGPPTNAYSATVMLDRPIRYYRLDETSGTIAHDSSGNHYDGTINGGITEGVPGLIIRDPDTAMSFDGISGYIPLPTTGLPTGAQSWSLECWVEYPLAAANYAPRIFGGTIIYPNPSNQAFISFGNRVDGAASVADLWFDQSVQKLALGFDTTGTTLYCTSFVQVGTIYHLVATYDGATARLYLNGTLQTSEAVTLNLASSIAWIGRNQHNDYSAFIEDEVALYNYALSAYQVQHHYTVGSSAVLALAMPLRAFITILGTKMLAVRSVIRNQVTRSLAIRTPIRTLKTVTLVLRAVIRGITRTMALRTVIRNQFTRSLAVRTLIRSQVTKSLVMRTLIRNQKTVSLTLRAVIRGITRTLVVRIPIRTMKTASLVARTVIRNQVTKSLATRTVIRTQKSISLTLRSVIRNQVSKSLTARTVIRSQRTASLSLRSPIATKLSKSLGLRVVMRNQVTRTLVVARTLIRTQKTSSMTLRTPIKTQLTKSLVLRTILRTLKTASLSLRTPIKTQVSKVLGLRSVLRNQVTKSLTVRTPIRTQKNLSLQTRVPVRNQVTRSLTTRTPVRTQVSKTLQTRVPVRTQKSLSLALRTIIFIQGMKSITLRARIKTQRSFSLTLRSVLRNQVTRSFPVRTRIRTQASTTVQFRIVIVPYTNAVVIVRSGTAVLTVRESGPN